METAPMMETKMALRPDLWSALDSFECNSTEMTYLEQIKVSLDTFPSRRTPGGVYVTDIFCGDSDLQSAWTAAGQTAVTRLNVSRHLLNRNILSFYLLIH